MINTQKVKTLKNIVNLAMDLDVDRRSRKHEYVVARAMCYKILKEECNMSVTYIGRRFNKNHATIMHSLKEFPYIEKYDQTINEIYNKCRSIYWELVQTDVDNKEMFPFGTGIIFENFLYKECPIDVDLDSIQYNLEKRH